MNKPKPEIADAKYRIQRDGAGEFYAEEWRLVGNGYRWCKFMALDDCINLETATLRLQQKIREENVQTMLYLDSNGRTILPNNK